MLDKIIFKDLRRGNIICHRDCKTRIYDQIASERRKEFLTFLKLQGIDTDNFSLEVFNHSKKAWGLYTTKITDCRIDVTNEIYCFCIALLDSNNEEICSLNAVTYIDERNIICCMKSEWCIVRFSNAIDKFKTSYNND